MKTIKEFIEILGTEKELHEISLQGSKIDVIVDYTESISINLKGISVYYGDEIENEEEAEIELSKVYDKYTELYNKY